jgi:lysophospholipase L1-like esterase
LRIHSSDTTSLVLAAVAAVVAVTCASARQERRASAPAPAPTPPAATAGASAAPVASAAPAASAPEVAPAVDAAAPPEHHELDRFRVALAALAAKKRKEPVRVLWLGDSHTAADFWTDAARQPLQKKYGNGGPGYVMVGLAAYRHEGVRVLSEGSWRREPSAPAGSAHQLDGVFGLGGQRVLPASQDARAAVMLNKGAVTGGARFTVVYRAKEPDKLRLSIRGGKSETVGWKDGSVSSGSTFRRVTLDGDDAAAFDIAVAGGAPEILGVFVESRTPGVVLDTLGINGARAATPLAWDAAAWAAEAKARAPSLFVLAYGTNEAAGAWKVSRYENSLEDLAKRVQAALPDTDCLVVGPPDMAATGGGSRPRVIEHDAAARAVASRVGCAFFSSFDAMGGEGSYARWARETPPLAAGDGVHLRAAGYARLGEQVAEALLSTQGGVAPR